MSYVITPKFKRKEIISRTASSSSQFSRSSQKSNDDSIDNIHENKEKIQDKSKLEMNIHNDEKIDREKNKEMEGKSFLNINFSIFPMLYLILFTYLADYYFFICLKIYFDHCDLNIKCYLYFILLTLVPSLILILKSRNMNNRSLLGKCWGIISFLPILLFNLEPVRLYFNLFRKWKRFNAKLKRSSADQGLRDDYISVLIENKELATVLLLRGLIQACPQIIWTFSNYINRYDDIRDDLRFQSIVISIFSFSLVVCYWQNSLFYLCGKKVDKQTNIMMYFSVQLITTGRLFSFGICISTLSSVAMYIIIFHTFFSYIWLSSTTMNHCSFTSVIFSSILNLILPPTNKVSSTVKFSFAFVIENFFMIGITLTKLNYTKFDELVQMNYYTGVFIMLGNIGGLGLYIILTTFLDEFASNNGNGINFIRKIKKKPEEDVNEETRPLNVAGPSRNTDLC